jgi:ABC transport system ATP-binding/permease protein
MSEEILKALMELFALIVKQDGGMLENERSYVRSFLKKQLTHDSVDIYMDLFDQHAGPVTKSKSIPDNISPSVKDSVKILSICKKINRTLNQVQKIVVLTRLYEMVNSDRQFTAQRMNIINTVAEVFRVSREEVSSIDLFIRNDQPDKLESPSILIIDDGSADCKLCGQLTSGFRDTTIIILKIPDCDIYFLKYISNRQLYLNGLPISPGSVYFFAPGSSIRSEQGKPVYYTDIVSKFMEVSISMKLSLIAEELTCMFSDGNTAVNGVSFSLSEGNLVGILGASGSGKTTLMNLLSGITRPTSGNARINGLDIHNNSRELEGVTGFVPQDDMLIESLTVFENMYFAAALSFRDKTKEEITTLAEKVLTSLDLIDKKDLKVGSTMNKVISGGQRKRLNIALELIREPSVLFLDEPTSGLSSRDSENVMDLLRELSLKGKLIITVIHQPSSDLFKMFDKVIILDQGGYLAYFGNPVESIIHFKKQDAQINSTMGECPSCGNVNADTIFRIMETRVVDEFGRYTSKRKVSPGEWNKVYRENNPMEPVSEIREAPHSNLGKPGPMKQLAIFLGRDLKSKIANRQYIALTLLEGPVLGFILSYIIRYIADPSSNVYIFFDNENIPIYIFMSIIVALFLGLIVSAEEIYRDRIILRREKFLNLSRNSYLLSKVIVMASISAIQVAAFLLVANNILEIKGLFVNYFIVLFTTAFCANLIGLNISASLNSAITIYIVIPLLMIPMMVLSGAMFPFDKLNRTIGSVDKVPFIAEIMPTRWTYEALMVSQFKDNMFSKVVYNEKDKNETSFYLEKRKSESEFNLDFRIPALKKALEVTLSEYSSDPKSIGINDEHRKTRNHSHFSKLDLLRNELSKESSINRLEKFSLINSLTPEEFNPDIADSLGSYLNKMHETYDRIYNLDNEKVDRFNRANDLEIQRLRNDYYNDKLMEIVTKYYEPGKSKMLEYRNNLVQNYHPIYKDPAPGNFPEFRTHFFAPSKFFLGRKVDTLIFNVSLVLTGTLLLYILLYLDAGNRLSKRLGRINLRKKPKL